MSWRVKLLMNTPLFTISLLKLSLSFIAQKSVGLWPYPTYVQ
jgi:hypothetical protein